MPCLATGCGYPTAVSAGAVTVSALSMPSGAPVSWAHVDYNSYSTVCLTNHMAEVVAAPNDKVVVIEVSVPTVLIEEAVDV